MTEANCNVKLDNSCCIIISYTKFRNVCDVKKQLVQPVLVWSRTFWILLSINGENVSLPVFT